MSTQEVICGDCLPIMKGYKDKQFDLVLCDPPYGVTSLEWDNDDTFWMNEVLRISKYNAPIIVFSTQPFTSKIIQEYRKFFKYEWIWEKDRPTGFANSATRPMKYHENIIVFCKSVSTYNPIFVKGEKDHRSSKEPTVISKSKSQPALITKYKRENNGDKYPSTIIRFNKVNGLHVVHPTEKPVELLKYLIQTYSKESDKILDPFLGSGTTLVAAKQLNRNAVGIEISEKYCEIARQRLSQQVLL